MPLNIIFMGTPAFAVSTLEAILGSSHNVCAVYTRAPKPGGRRGLTTVKTPVHQCAEQNDLPVFTPSSFKHQQDIDQFVQHKADVAVVVAYGLLLPLPILDAPRLGCLNVHASILPTWRGAAPIHRAIMAGDSESGVAIMKMEEGLDTGPVGLVETVPIGPIVTTGQLHDQLAVTGAELLVEALNRMNRDELSFTPQSGPSTYARKILKTETRIDWSQPAQAVHNHIRGLSPFPGAWFELPTADGMVRVKVLQSELVGGNQEAGTIVDGNAAVACGRGAVRLLRLQKAGAKPLDTVEFLRGTELPVGTRLG